MAMGPEELERELERLRGIAATRSRPPQTMRYLATGIVGILAIIILCFAISQTRKTWAWVHHAERTTGKVVDLDETSVVADRDRMNHVPRTASTYVVVVSYQLGGKSHHVYSSSYLYKWMFEEGEQVAVLYAPNHPSDARLDSILELWGGSIGLWFFGLLLGGLALAAFFLMRGF